VTGTSPDASVCASSTLSPRLNVWNGSSGAPRSASAAPAAAAASAAAGSPGGGAGPGAPPGRRRSTRQMKSEPIWRWNVADSDVSTSPLCCSPFSWRLRAP